MSPPPSHTALWSECRSKPRTLVFRDKNRLPVTPILSSVLRLVRYHLGTVAKGSFIITLVKVPRLILMYIHNQLKGRVLNFYCCRFHDDMQS